MANQPLFVPINSNTQTSTPQSISYSPTRQFGKALLQSGKQYLQQAGSNFPDMNKLTSRDATGKLLINRNEAQKAFNIAGSFGPGELNNVAKEAKATYGLLKRLTSADYVKGGKINMEALGAADEFLTKYEKGIKLTPDELRSAQEAHYMLVGDRSHGTVAPLDRIMSQRKLPVKSITDEPRTLRDSFGRFNGSKPRSK